MGLEQQISKAKNQDQVLVLAGAKPRWASLVPMHQGKHFFTTN